MPCRRMLMCVVFSLFLGLPFSGLPVAFSAKTPYPVYLEPGKTVPQGGIVYARFTVTDTLPSTVNCYFSKKAYPVFRIDDTHYQAVIGLNVDQKPGGYTLALRTSAESEALSEAVVVQVLAYNYGRQNISVSGKTAGLQPIPGELAAIGQLKKTTTPIRFWSPSTFVSPTIDCENSPFGVRRYHNGRYINDYHKGVDLRSPQGRNVVATAGGVVKIATLRYRLHGGTVGIDHGQGVTSIYIHLSQVNVKEGQHVSAGEAIGKVGSTGFATGPHLHWGLFVTGEPVDPNQWVPYHRCQ